MRREEALRKQLGTSEEAMRQQQLASDTALSQQRKHWQQQLQKELSVFKSETAEHSDAVTIKEASTTWW